MPICHACGKAESLARFHTIPLCGPCIRPRLLRQSRTVAEFISLSERLAALGAAVPTQAIDSFKRETETNASVADAFRSVSDDLDAFHARLATSREVERRGDEELADDLDSLMDDNFYYLHHWLAESECSPLVYYCATHPALSLLAHIRLLEGNDREATAAWDGVKYFLFGDELPFRSLLDSPSGPQLAEIDALAFGLGLARMVELAGILRDGYPPSDRFSEDERLLLVDLDSDSVRRASRTWHLYKNLASDTKRLNDRAEILLQLWLLYPIKGPARDYLRLMYDSFVRGEDAVAVILSRSVLERIISEAYDRASTATPSIPDSMNRKITFLRARRLLTAPGSRRARDVWERGNKTIHQDPKLVADARDTIEATLQVVAELASSL